jgi:hypothetical protein
MQGGCSNETVTEALSETLIDPLSNPRPVPARQCRRAAAFAISVAITEI